MRKILGLFVFAMLLATKAMAQPVPSFSQDPCINPPNNQSRQSFTATISTAVSTSLVAPVTGAPIWVCSVQILHPGGTGGMGIQYGTGSTCQTGTTVIRGAFLYNTSAGTSTVDNYPPNPGTAFIVPASNRLCAVSTGTIVQVVTGTYVQMAPQ